MEHVFKEQSDSHEEVSLRLLAALDDLQALL